ncbi:recombinase RecT [Dubosiella newyorkensis]|uniref:recombinase RecT n=1 Tax=Dubosiella newyorkensis TaxID=1862672 RepID=UPI00272E754E|nr:recombinase RecT [Dubosiella newyorkensis]
MTNEVKEVKNTGDIQKKREPKSTKDWLKVYEGEIAKALPTQVGPERFNRICATMLTANPKLAQCTPESFIGAVLNSAQLGLEPNTPLGEAYLIPYGNNVQFILGYRGMIRLARNSGEIAMIKAHAVHANDEFHYELGLNPNITHVPASGDRGPVIAYYAFYKTKDGDFDFEVDTKAALEAHGRKYSKTYAKGPWTTDFDAMAKKTLIKRVLKFAPLNTEIAIKIAQDETVKNYNPKESEIMSDMTLVQDEPIEAEYEEHEAQS